jgi:hypothetical protein
MNRLPAISLLVSAALVALAPAAEAKPRVHTDVTVRNATSFRLKGEKLRARRANGHKLTVKLEPIAKGKRRVVHVTGTAHGWSVDEGYSRCTAHKRHKVGCVVRDYGTGAIPVGVIPAPTPAAAPTPAPKTAGIFAPYTDMAGWPAPDLPQRSADSGATHVSLGFVTQAKAGGCTPAWGGVDTYPAAGAAPYRHDNVAEFQRAGGEAIPSFGGDSGTELVYACQSADALAGAYQSVIDAYGFTRVDFDIEGATLMDTGASITRDKAIAKLQQNAAAAGRRLVVGFTLPSTLSGLDGLGRQTVKDAIAQGVQLSYVNLMTMNLGFAGDMGAFSTGAGNSLMTQLAQPYPALTPAQIARMVGVTPMIGINNQAFEIFGLADAATVQAWASQNHIGMLGAWSLGRDVQCPAPVAVAQTDCSGVDQASYAFAKALGAFTG